jgi:DNA-binding transcriptional MerR regulator
MENAVYCLASTEPQANEILTHLRNLGFSASEISVLLKDKDTRNISVKEDAIRGAEKGGIAGALGALALTVLSVPVLGPLAVAGPIVSVLGGAVAGGVVGGLAGGSGALTPIGIPNHISARLEQKLHDGAILIAVHSSDPVRRDKAMRVFKSAGAEEITDDENLAA